MKILIRSNADASQPFGTFTRPVWLGESLARLGHEVVHLCPRPPRLSDAAAAYGIARSSEGLGSLATPDSKASLQVLNFRPDVLYVHELRNLHQWFLRTLRIRPSFVDAHASWAMENLAWGNAREARKAQITERLATRGAKGIIAASQELRAFLHTQYGFPEESLHVVGNGIPDHLVAASWDGEAWRQRFQLNGEPLLLHVAPAHFRSNDLSMGMLREVARLVRAHGLDPQIVVTGRTDVTPGVTALGTVEDYLGLLDAADIALLPYPPTAICGGARNKTLEFLARGKAIVSTSEGMRGVEAARAGIHYLPAETPEEFASAIERLARDPPARKRLERAAAELGRGLTWSVRAREVARVFGAS